MTVEFYSQLICILENFPNEKIKAMIEKEISKDGYASFLYAKTILRNRFQLGESAIISDNEILSLYLREVIENKNLGV